MAKSSTKLDCSKFNGTLSFPMKYRTTIAHSSLRPAVHNRSGAKRTREIGCVAISCPFFFQKGWKDWQWFVYQGGSLKLAHLRSRRLCTRQIECVWSCACMCFVHMAEQCTVRAPIWWSKWRWTCPPSRCPHFVTIGVARKSSLLLFFPTFRWNDSTLYSFLL